MLIHMRYPDVLQKLRSFTDLYVKQQSANLLMREKRFNRRVISQAEFESKDSMQSMHPYTDRMVWQSLFELQKKLNNNEVSADLKYRLNKINGTPSTGVAGGYKLEASLRDPTFIYLTNLRNDTSVKSGFLYNYPFAYEIYDNGDVLRTLYQTNPRESSVLTTELITNPDEIQKLFKGYEVQRQKPKFFSNLTSRILEYIH